MKIVHLVFSLGIGGIESMLVDIANVQSNYSKVYIVILNNLIDNSLLRNLNSKIKICFINRPQGSRNIYYLIKLNYVLTKINGDIIHCHNHKIIRYCLSIFRKKAMLTVHNMYVPVEYFNLYLKLFAISKAVKDDIMRRSGLESILIYNGVQVKDIKPKVDDKINLDNVKLLIVSRLRHQQKGQHLAIEALHILNQRGFNHISLYLIGKGESESHLKDLAKKFNVEDQIKFVGEKSREHIYNHIKDYDILIQPSLFEGFGITIIEAMAAKLPVIVSNIDGPTEIIENGKYGYCYESNNSNDLARVIYDCVNSYNSKEMNAKINDAYLYVSKTFDIENVSKEYLNEYFLAKKHELRTP